MTNGGETDESIQRTNFRGFVQVAAQQLLEQSGFHGNPEAMLVGFPMVGDNEPWIDSFDAANYSRALTLVLKVTEVLLRQRGKVFSGLSPLDRAWIDGPFRERIEAAALRDVLNSRSASRGRTFFVSRPARVEGHGARVGILQQVGAGLGHSGEVH
ncbi:hypothetical protein AB0C13_39930, partial [Streptomyces sp. NPDC049099]|uniref:hypothetical protein n=1 Tax=Streptomyces sp. NPDC049099 TaxID=3155768 RepID=UPI003446C1C2